MKNKLFLLAFLISGSIFAQQATVKEAFLEKWENSKNYLIAVAEAMPEKQYNFKPTEREMSFQEQLLHIKGNMDWLSTTYFSDKEFDRSEKASPTTKAEVIELLNTGFDHTLEIISASSEEDLATTVEFFAGPKSKLQILNLLLDHVTHHRGQLIVYLNLNEIKPPRYVGW
ncbi:MAG: DinB family protein [Bacteroidota bacterium]